MLADGPYLWLVTLQLVLAVVTFVALSFVVAPYGRHERRGWGPTVPARLGWLVMELPASVLFLAFYLLGEHRLELAPLVLLGLWQLHYVHRAFVYPLLLRGGGRMPLVVAALGFAFNVLNSWINARWVSQWGDYAASWLLDPRFVAGAALFVAGFALNVHSDRTLRGLRRDGATGYRVPNGGGFRYVSSPNYLGEIVEWTGWALATWSLAGLAFALYTFANLAPRALAHHRWYRATFEDYPRERKALVPYLM